MIDPGPLSPEYLLTVDSTDAYAPDLWGESLDDSIRGKRDARKRAVVCRRNGSLSTRISSFEIGSVTWNRKRYFKQKSIYCLTNKHWSHCRTDKSNRHALSRRSRAIRRRDSDRHTLAALVRSGLPKQAIVR